MRIEDYKDNEEVVLWKGKPNKSVFVKERIFTPLAIFALIWLIFDIGFLTIIFTNFNDNGPGDIFKFMIIPFMILHLAPVWLYLGRIIFSVREYSNTEFMVTDRAVYATSGVFTTKCDRKTFQEITNVSFRQGVIDKMHNVGDVFIATGTVTTKNGGVKPNGINIIDIDDYLKVYKLINKTAGDIFSDTMYPNDLRPRTNHGYNTKYENDEE